MRMQRALTVVLLCCGEALGFVPSTSLRGRHPTRSTASLSVRHPTGPVFPRQPHEPSQRRTLAQCSSSSSSSSGALNNENKLDRPWQRWLSQRLLGRPNAFSSTALLVALDVIFRQAFVRAKIRFPSSLAGCGVVLVALLVAQRRQRESSRDMANNDDDDTASSSLLYRHLQPGAALLAKWLPVFFVPSLVTLPVGTGDWGGALDMVKVSFVLVGGFLLTLYSTAWAVQAVRHDTSNEVTTTTAMETTTNREPVERAPSEETSNATITATSQRSDSNTNNSKPAKPFSGKLLSQLTAASVTSGLLATWGFFGGAVVSTVLTRLCFLTSTLATFVWGARLPTAFTQWVHPLVTCTALTWTVVAALAQLTGHTFRGLLRTYRTGSVWTGAGDALLFLLGPAVVSLAVSMFERRRLVRDDATAVATAVGVATVGGVGGTALLVRWAGIGIPAVRLSLLSRNITSPLAMAMASFLGADISLAVSMVVITGLVGANFGARLLTAAGITDPVARGLSMGAAAHGLGTAALARSEPDAFSFSAIAMALVASAATVTVSIPVLRRLVLELALG